MTGQDPRDQSRHVALRARRGQDGYTEVAIKEGFRHVDCAAIYKNEKVVDVDV